MKPKRFVSSLSAVATLVVAVSVTPSLNASTIAWDGSDSTAWATGTNWTGDIAPANNLVTDIALFNLASYTNQPDAGTTAIKGITIGDGVTATGALTISGTSLSIGSSGISMLANAGATTISAPITLGAAQTWTNNSTNALSVGSIAPTAGSGTSVIFSGTGTIKTTNTNTNGILGAWAVTGMAGTTSAVGNWATADGSGNIVTYTGYTDITGANTGATGATENWRSSNNAASLTASATVNSLVMTTDFNIQSGATMTVGSGGMILSGASKWLKNNGAGTIAGTGQITSGLASGELFIYSSGNATNAADNDWRIWTKLVDNGGTAVKLIKDGPGFLDLQNANTYTGGTILNGGRLSVSNNSALGTGALTIVNGTLCVAKAGSNITLANNIALSGTGNILLGATRNLTLNGTLSGSGTLTLGNDTANSSIFLGGSNTMTSGTITVANSTNSVRISNANFGNANVAWVFNNTTANKTTLDFTTATIEFGSMTGTGTIQGNNTGTKTIQAGALGLNDTFSGTINNGSGILALNKVGNGTMTLSGNSGFTGGTTITAGALNVTGGLADTGAVNVNGGTYTIGANDTVGAVTLTSGTINGSFTLTGSSYAAQSGAVSAKLAGTGGLTKSTAGTVTLSGVNTYTGATAVNAGTLSISSTGSLGASSAVTVANTATLTNNGTIGGSVTVNTGGTLNGSGTFNGAVAVNGALNPGNSPGSQTYAAGLTLGAASVTTMEIAGLGGVAGTDFDFINVTGGTLTNDGTLAIVDFGGYDISAQTGTYNLFDFVTGAGDFDGVTVDGNALTFNVGTDDWSATVGDATYNFAEGTGVLSVTVVPEPTAALLGGLGMLGLLRRRRVA